MFGIGLRNITPHDFINCVHHVVEQRFEHEWDEYEVTPTMSHGSTRRWVEQWLSKENLKTTNLQVDLIIQHAHDEYMRIIRQMEFSPSLSMHPMKTMLSQSLGLNDR
jgi:hypothetical protein